MDELYVIKSEINTKLDKEGRGERATGQVGHQRPVRVYLPFDRHEHFRLSELLEQIEQQQKEGQHTHDDRRRGGSRLWPPYHMYT